MKPATLFIVLSIGATFFLHGMINILMCNVGSWERTTAEITYHSRQYNGKYSTSSIFVKYTYDDTEHHAEMEGIGGTPGHIIDIKVDRNAPQHVIPGWILFEYKLFSILGAFLLIVAGGQLCYNKRKKGVFFAPSEDSVI